MDEFSTLATRVVHQMMKEDAFSQWMGIKVLETGSGLCRLEMKVRKEMLNGFHILHGGITYSLADSALAFASNSHGIKSVSIETSISHIEPCKEGDVLTASAEEISKTNRTGIYYINITNQDQKRVAVFKGTVYRTGKEWFPSGN